jgi:hypothetical protein
MSLNFDLSKITDYRNACHETFTGSQEEMEERMGHPRFFGGNWSYEGSDRSRIVRLHPVTEALVFSTMSVMMGSITEKNWREFYSRVAMKEAALGASLINGDGSPAYITPEQVRAHIGLTTNVRTESAGKFNGWLVRGLRRDAESRLRRETESLAESRVSE